MPLSSSHSSLSVSPPLTPCTLSVSPSPHSLFPTLSISLIIILFLNLSDSWFQVKHMQVVRFRRVYVQGCEPVNVCQPCGWALVSNHHVVEQSGNFPPGTLASTTVFCRTNLHVFCKKLDTIRFPHFINLFYVSKSSWHCFQVINWICLQSEALQILVVVELLQLFVLNKKGNCEESKLEPIDSLESTH